jgi:methionyl aminopeptidase
MIYKKSPAEIAIMREGGSILGRALDEMSDAVKPGVTSLDLDRLFEEALARAGAAASFKGYRGFPASICASPNQVIVHGIPNSAPLEEGDIITVDLGVFYQGFHTDSAWTFPVGEVAPETQRLLETTKASLRAAVAEARPGNRLGDIGHAIETVVDAAGFSLVADYGGHGIGRSLHEDPFVHNFGPPGRREKLTEGMTLAIEPMVNVGGPSSTVLEDEWTVVTKDGSLSAHFEHTVAILPEGPEVLTVGDGRRGEL